MSEYRDFSLTPGQEYVALPWPVVEQDEENGLVYVRVAKGKIARTSMVVQDQVIADFDADDHLLGVEIL